MRRICIATAWLGQPAGDRIGDGWIWAEYWTRYFTDREPQHSWVVERVSDGGVAGYLTGTADVGRFNRHVPFLVPGIILRVIRKRLIRRAASRRALFAILGCLAAGELSLPPGLGQAYPATWHMNLSAEAWRKGLATRMFGLFLDRLRRLGTPGLHAQTLSVNEPIAAFLRRAGFELVARGPLHAFPTVDGQAVELLTWVRPL